jgi:peptidoglycan/LPS O-acetylase OafA/YrhL
VAINHWGAFFYWFMWLHTQRTMIGMAGVNGISDGSIPKEMAPRNRLFDVMRLFLALEVFLIVHEGARLGAAVADLWCPLQPVPCFLAISGFLVLQSLERTNTYLQFAKKRLLRVMPALVVSLVLYIVLFGPATFKANMIVYLTAGLVVPTKGFKNGPLWSLSVEEVAYVAMAIIFAAGWYRRRWPIFLVAAALWIAVLIAPVNEVTGRYLPVLLAFPVGSLIYLYRDKLSCVNPWITVALGAFAIAHPIWGWHAHWLKATLPIMQPALVVAFCAFGPKIKIPAFPDISYGIYIYHMAVIQWCAISAPELDAWQHLAILVALCLVSWYLIEKPMLNLKEQPLRYRQRNHEPLDANTVSVLAPAENANI